jgi:hypothetical protein
MKRILTTLLIIGCALAPYGVQAATSTTQVQDLTLKLQALKAYVSRIQGAGAYTKPSNDTLRASIQDGTSWLLGTQEQNGHFAYEYAPYEDEYLGGDNIVRQAGALFALGEVYLHTKSPGAELGEGIKKAIGYFESLTIPGKEGKLSFSCIGTTIKGNDCKLGATALALVGMLDYVEKTPRAASFYTSLIEEYTAFILAAQKENGGFRDLYRTESGFVNRESPYSNGEAMLALVRMYKHSPQTEVKSALDSAFDYLKTTEHVNPLYLWIMAALKDMQVLWPNPEYISYAREFTQWRIKTGSYPKQQNNYCPYVEGLVSAYSVLKAAPEPGELEALRAHIDPWHGYHRTLQVDGGEIYRVIFEGGVPSLGTLANPPLAHGGFLTSHTVATQRIDFTQHCISASLQTLVDIDAQAL